MEKKRKWERDYENYANSTELDERIEYLTDLTNGKVAMKEEYDELKRLSEIKENLPKVKNILELREQLQAQRKEVEAEIKKIEHFEKLKSVETVLENQMKKLEIEYANLGSKIKSPDLKPEEKAEIKNKMQLNEKAREENNIKFGKCHERMREYQVQEKFKRMTLDDMKKQCTQISMNISKCNLACNKLMKGYSWQSVEVALDKFENEKLTAKGVNAKKMQQNRVAAKVANIKEVKSKSENTETKLETKKVETVKSQPVKVEKTIAESKTQNEEKSLEVPTRWIKIKGWAKNLFEKWFVEEVDEENVNNEKESKESKKPKKKSLISRLKAAYHKFMEKEEVEEQEVVAPKKQEQEKSNPEETKIEEKVEEKIETKQDSFRQYLKDVAEKGIEGVEQEKAHAEKMAKEVKRQAAREKLEANRAAALNREAERDNKNGDAR